MAGSTFGTKGKCKPTTANNSIRFTLGSMKGGVRAYARHRKEIGLPSVDPMSVEKAIKSGRITRDADGEIDFEKADRDWEQNTRPAMSPNEDNGGLAQYSRARAIREYYQASLAKIEYEQKVGKLLPKDEVQAAAFNTYRQFREQLLNIPDRVAAIIAAETGMDTKKVHEILTAEVRHALNEFADPPNRSGL